MKSNYFLALFSLIFLGCVPANVSDESHEFSNSVVLNDLNNRQNRYRLWYDESGKYLLVINETFSGETRVVYLEGILAVSKTKIETSYENISSGTGDNCVLISIFGEEYGSPISEKTICDLAKNDANFEQLLKYFDLAFEKGIPKGINSVTSWNEYEWTTPSSKLSHIE